MIYPTAPDLTGSAEASILPWLDPTVDPIGYDPRSHYAEAFWLPILGPSSLWLMRRLAQRFDLEPDGFTLDLDEASAALGIRSEGGRNTSFQRSIARVVSFNMGRTVDDNTIEVRRVMPLLHHGQIRRLSPRLQRAHEEAKASRLEHRKEDIRRSTQVAITLLGLGDSPNLVEQQLVSWGIEPRSAGEAVLRARAARDSADSEAA